MLYRVLSLGGPDIDIERIHAWKESLHESNPLKHGGVMQLQRHCNVFTCAVDHPDVAARGSSQLSNESWSAATFYFLETIALRAIGAKEDLNERMIQIVNGVLEQANCQSAGVAEATLGRDTPTHAAAVRECRTR